MFLLLFLFSITYYSSLSSSNFNFFEVVTFYKDSHPLFCNSKEWNPSISTYA